MEVAEHIAVDERVCSGKPVIRGTRVPVELVIGQLGGGMTVDLVAREYELTRVQVLAALRYAAETPAGN